MNGKRVIRAKNLLAEVFQMPVEDIPDDAAIGEVDQWDSLGHMRLLMALEAELGKTLDTETLLQIDCLEKVDNLLSGR